MRNGLWYHRIMARIELIATATFGLEAVVKREIEALGYAVTDSRDGRLTYLADERGIVRSNLWLRSADRVYVKMAEFEAKTFDDLFQNVAGIAWEEWIPFEGKFTVVGTSVKSQLHSVPGCQSIVKKAIVTRLQQTYGDVTFPESGAPYTVRFAFQKDVCCVMLDTSGTGLHKRGYRVMDVAAPIKETLAAAMVSLSFFGPGRVMADPFCGSGTVAIEAAMQAKNIAPGLSRKFASEGWVFIPREIWKEERSAAFAAIKESEELEDTKIYASDIDPKAVRAAKENALEAGVDDLIEFAVRPFRKFAAQEDLPERGMLITNPPYGQRIGEQKELDAIYRDLKTFTEHNPTWSAFVITADKTFESKLGRPADRRRKLYNGRIETCYYQIHGTK